ncbi:hypothetical protein NA56DRAFT_88118 [Hyaloscypha hepaticicola]|uniref:Uncharacterized protein n=1 Tax=Hyaloscypha hepaticicola TaxID=2082293 RepID=A0A2J6Q853_9HELO|nr:hypothetical protein NA56DRAFT_88118 [Hyaloscypha hepaticicola]
MERRSMCSESVPLLTAKPIKLKSCSTSESYMFRTAWELAVQLAAERITSKGRGDRRQLSDATKLALASETTPQHYKARKRDTPGPNLDKTHDSSLAAECHTPSQNSEPILHYPQNVPSPPALRSSGDDPRRQNHDGDISQTNGARPGSPGRWTEPDIEMSDISLRDVESEPPPPNDESGDNITQAIRPQKVTSIFSLPLCGIAVFLAPVNIVSGMTASHGDNWKLAFVGFFISWLVIGTAWLFLDLRGLQRSRFTKRCLWHLGGCAVSLYFFMSILHITSDHLPQWLPTIIDCGIGASLGFQAIPSSARERVGEAITSVIGGIFGGTQVIVRRDEERHLSENEPSSTRRRRADIEEGLVS